ncbi:type II toxin-antitoxin system MqsA family antitoxin [Terriglobus sp.]|uniref:type II toxin-antitoxin system MqsA family antitoxin n=1 Tax=Terriglobus sp. TaxID=1889013 RepID=UPI003AFFDA42
MVKNCPTCGEGELASDTRPITFARQGETMLLEEVHGDFCPCCGEVILGMLEAERVSRRILGFNALKPTSGAKARSPEEFQRHS